MFAINALRVVRVVIGMTMMLLRSRTVIAVMCCFAMTVEIMLFAKAVNRVFVHYVQKRKASMLHFLVTTLSATQRVWVVNAMMSAKNAKICMSNALVMIIKDKQRRSNA